MSVYKRRLLPQLVVTQLRKESTRICYDYQKFDHVILFSWRCKLQASCLKYNLQHPMYLNSWTLLSVTVSIVRSGTLGGIGPKICHLNLAALMMVKF
jgi:hypothetical protein